MDSSAKISKLSTRMMPYLAILQHDMRALWASRLVRLWLAATAVLTLMLALANWSKFQDAPMIATLLFPYLVFPWFFVVVVLGVSPVSGSRAEALADGILSRPVSRSGYLIAVWFARVMLVWSIYLIVIVPFIVLVTLAKRPVLEDMVTIYGIVTVLFLVGLVLTFLVSLGFLMGTLLRKPLLAVVVLIFVWYPIGLILSVFSLEEFSPISLAQALPTQLRQPWREVEEGPKVNANKEDMDAFTNQFSHFLNVLSGTKPQPKADTPDFFESEEFANFSLLRVTLGYGIPTLLTIILATLSFYWRDL